ncbi:MAG: hypothetical protein LUG93_17530 [Lachnospiraceae bacterium]|nr:hypothetical protein [Lachnospiraceae bacterium]
MYLYNSNALRIDAGDFMHPLDRAAMETVMKSPGFDKLIGYISEHSLERVYGFLYHSSYLKITEQISADLHGMMDEALNLFNWDGEKPELFLQRSFDYSTEVSGINRQYVLLSTSLLEGKDEEILWPVMAACAAGVCARHGTIEFLAQVIELLGSFSPIPFLEEGLKTAINSWRRARIYTEDRAYLIASRDFNAAVRHIYMGDVPTEILNEIDFQDTSNDCYLQAEEFLHDSQTVVNLMRKMQTVFSPSQWKASRYMELYNWYMSGEYDNVLEGGVRE